MRKRLKRVALFFDAVHSTSSEVIDFDEFMSSTGGHSTATMMCRKESVQVALLQTHGEDGAYLSVLFGSLIGVSSCISARCVPRDIPFFLTLKLLN